jgi:hypothetical protein
MSANPIQKGIIDTESNPSESDEAFVTDTRGCQSPSEVIEQKLSRLLKDTPIQLSHLTVNRRIRRGK